MFWTKAGDSISYDGHVHFPLLADRRNFTDHGLVGIGNAARSPRVMKEVIDQYLKPLLIGADPWDVVFLWQHTYRKTMAFGRKGIGMMAYTSAWRTKPRCGSSTRRRTLG